MTDPAFEITTKEGIFGEPASAASLAGLIKMIGQGLDLSGKKVVCIVTGTGLKDPNVPIKGIKPFPELPADVQIIEQALGFS